MAMLLLTFSVFGGVMIFATVVYPGGIREALARTQIFHFDGGENGKNITSSGRLKDLILCPLHVVVKICFVFRAKVWIL